MLFRSLWHRWLRRGVPRVRRAARAALAAVRRSGGAPLQVDVTLTGDAELKRLNARWRGKNKPTNVLSFPADTETRAAGGARLLGDVIVAAGVAVAEARAERKSLDDHLDHLVVHGVLHLMGYDHEAVAQAREMEGLERRILAKLGVKDPYRARARAADAP